MDVLHSLLLPYLTRVAALWPDPPPTPDEPDGPIPGLVDESN